MSIWRNKVTPDPKSDKKYFIEVNEYEYSDGTCDYITEKYSIEFNNEKEMRTAWEILTTSEKLKNFKVVDGDKFIPKNINWDIPYATIDDVDENGEEYRIFIFGAFEMKIVDNVDKDKEPEIKKEEPKFPKPTTKPITDWPTDLPF